ncbi:AAA family ATPase [Paenibacillus thailandensis]|uniref:AAA family ATPase n=1 Tax=Paenibacillus thailandensis TaxID=393250 RepID=A0ABW5R3H6_9BACL
MNSRIELLSLILRYFKGIIDFTLQADGQNVDVYGDNAAGKTTLFDGWNWLLFDKDSQNKKDFSIKTQDETGAPIPKLDHEVEGVLLINGRQHTLKKVFREKWTKKRGSASDEFTGHETNYFIDGVPVKQAEYKSFIDSIINEDRFKLLTSPTFFNEQLDWKKRRPILLEICGDISDSDVIASNPELAELPELLDNRTLHGHRSMISARMKAINDELKKIPVRVDEAQRAMPDTGGFDEKRNQEQLEALKGRIQSKEEELNRIQSGGEIAVKQNRIREIEGELLQIKNNLQAWTIEKLNEQRRQVSRIKGDASDLGGEISRLKSLSATNQQIIAEKTAEMERLRSQWKEVDAEQFEISHSADTCPACGQQLPADAIAAAHEKALVQFNRSKAERLEEINAKGRAAKAACEERNAENKKLADRIAALQEKLDQTQVLLQTETEELNKMESGLVDVETDPAYISKLQEKTSVEREIVGLRSASLSALEQVRQELSKLRLEADRLERNKIAFDQARSGKERIATLKQQEKQLAKEYEELERQNFLTEEFIRTKVSLLESRINSKFKHVRFKLFETQINGGVQECCETLYGSNLVAYSSGLNNAARINAGLDIINTLSEHYGTTAPIFIDNAESVTELLPTDSQQIRLIVSAADKKLRVEQNNKYQEATLF